MEKIATDLKQSEQIAKILPIESADMFYYKNIFFGALSAFNGALLPRGNQEIKEEKMIPAWSLSALMAVLPIKFDWEFETYEFRMRIYYYSSGEKYYDIGYQGSCGCLLYADAKNLVDACVEMILKIKEKELL